MSTGQNQMVVLGLDWNGTVVDDDERARLAVVAVLDHLQLSVPHLESVAGFRETFCLPLERYFSSLGVPHDAVGWAIAEWNRHVRAGPKPRLVDGAELLLGYAEEAGVPVHVVSGADYEAVTGDADVLIPGTALASVQGAVHPKRKAIRALAGPGQIAVYVGDTSYDVREARAADAMAIGRAHDRANAERLHAVGAHLVVESLDEVIHVLRRLAANRTLKGHTHV